MIQNHGSIREILNLERLMRQIFPSLIFGVNIFLSQPSLILALEGIEGEIEIDNFTDDSRGWFLLHGATNVNAGPAEGQMLNVHYFPGLLDYANGNFTSAHFEMSYVIGGARHIEKNPNKAKILSNAHYHRGMIYMYHAKGHKRILKAREDFLKSIEWAPQNFLAYLELSRVYNKMNLREQALSVLQILLKKTPPEKILQQAEEEYRLLMPNSSKSR